jgi:hypothetical protein
LHPSEEKEYAVSGSSDFRARPDHKFHVFRACERGAACGDETLDNWLISERWIFSLDAETICAKCLAVLKQEDRQEVQSIQSE